MPDTITLLGKVITDGLKARDTLITITTPAEKPKTDIFDSGALTFFLTIAVPLFIFWLGNKFSQFNKKADTRNELINSKKALEIWILQLESSINSLSESCKQSATSATEMPFLTGVDFYKIPTLVNKLSTLNIDKYQSYTSLSVEGDIIENSKRSYVIMNLIECLIEIEKQIDDRYKENGDKLIELVTKWNEANKEFIDIHLNMLRMVALHENHAAKEFSNKVFELTKLNKPANIKDWEANFSKPIHELIYLELKNNPNNTFAEEILKPIMKTRLIVNDALTEQRNFAQKMEALANNLTNLYQQLKNQVLELQKRKIKPVKNIR